MLRALALALLMTVWVAAMPAEAQVEPADSIIKAALQDLDRFEKQAEGLTSSRKARAQRILNLLELVEQRLDGSANKEHASWIAASSRLQALKARLTALAEGKPAPATAPPPQAAPATAGEDKGPAPDASLAGAITELDAIEAEVAKLQPGDKKAARGYIERLKGVRGKLESSKSRKNPSFNEAVRRYNALNKRVPEIANAAPSGGAPADAGPPDPQVAEALTEIERFEGLAEGLEPGDLETAKAHLEALKPVLKKLQQAPNKGHPKWREARDRYNAVNKAIAAKGNEQPTSGKFARLTSTEQAWLAKLDRELKSSRAQLEKIDIAELQREETVKSWRRSVANMRGRHAKFQAKENRDVMGLGPRIDEVEKLLEQKVAESQTQLAALGDVKGNVDKIEGRYRKNPVPSGLRTPFTEAQAQEFASRVATTYKASLGDFAYLNKIEGKTTLVPKDRIARLKNWVGSEVPRRLKQSVDQTRQAADAWVETHLRTADGVKQTDPKDASHAANRLLGQGTVDKTVGSLQEGITAVKAVAALDKGLGRKDAPDRQAQLARFQGAIAEIEEKYEIALGDKRMPEPADDHDKMAEIAEEVLKKPSYGVNPYKRLVVNSNVRRKEKKEAVASGNTLTVYTYVWDQFQVTTAEKVGDEYYLFHNTMKYFHKAHPKTPTERWLVSDRFQGSRILEENIDD
jgi:hypothetical protein